MISFEHHFRNDLQQVLKYHEQPICFVRFADGERAILEGKQVRTADGWTVPAEGNLFSLALWSSFQYTAPNWYVGYSCPCCDPEGHGWLMSRSQVPPDHRTFSNLFVNANWKEALERLTLPSLRVQPVIVGSRSFATIKCAANLVNAEGDWLSPIVAQMYEQQQPILLAAGPASNIIAHRYWTTVPGPMRQTVIDIGSMLDHCEGAATRSYHLEGHANQTKHCKWS